jgi:hypothetical protein
MSERDAPRGWFGIAAPLASETAETKPAPVLRETPLPPPPTRDRPLVTPPRAVPPTRKRSRRSGPVVTPARGAAPTRKRSRSATGTDVGILVLAALGIFPGLLLVVSGGKLGLFLGGLEFLLGVGLLTRNEFARIFYLVLAFISCGLILLGSDSASGGVVIANLVIQLIPMVFLMRSSVAAKFE